MWSLAMQFYLVKCVRTVQFNLSLVGSSSDFSLTRERRSVVTSVLASLGLTLVLHDNDLVVVDGATAVCGPNLDAQRSTRYLFTKYACGRTSAASMLGVSDRSEKLSAVLASGTLQVVSSLVDRRVHLNDQNRETWLTMCLHGAR